jgi:hypothetical protein
MQFYIHQAVPFCRYATRGERWTDNVRRRPLTRRRRQKGKESIYLCTGEQELEFSYRGSVVESVWCNDHRSHTQIGQYTKAKRILTLKNTLKTKAGKR